MTELIIVQGVDHSPLGPSSSKRWLNCPGSVNASKDAADSESEFAAEGSAAHAIAERCRAEGKLAKDYIGRNVVIGAYKFEVTAEFADAVQEFMDWCDEAPGQRITETRVHYNEYGVPNGFGWLDDGRLAEEICTLTDFKFGKGVQEFAEENSQLKLQALGVLQDFGYLYKIKAFNLRICQPRLDHKDEWKITTAALLKWAKTLPQAVYDVNQGKRFAAGAWCQFCRIRKTCAVRANSALQTLLQDFTDLESELPPPRDLNQLTPELAAKILPTLSIAEKWFKEFKRLVIGWLIEGKTIGEWKLVEGRSNRQWKDPQGVVFELQEAGIEPYERSLRSVADVEKEVGKKAFGQSNLADQVRKPPGKPKLVPGDDRRPAMTTSALNEFTNLDADEDDET